MTAFTDFFDTEFSYFDADRAGESIAATICALFRAAGDDFAVALIANSTHALEGWIKKGSEN